MPKSTARSLLPLAGVLLLSACSAPAQAGGAAAAGPGAGALYTEAQGGRGQAVFTRSCASCHGPGEFGGRLFEMGWSGKPLGDFFGYIRTSMPYDRPGSLSDQEYADLLAYVLQLNRYPTGNRELPPDAGTLSALRFR
jgi:mono/diheme cytochrome c family protein